MLLRVVTRRALPPHVAQLELPPSDCFLLSIADRRRAIHLFASAPLSFYTNEQAKIVVMFATVRFGAFTESRRTAVADDAVRERLLAHNWREFITMRDYLTQYAPALLRN